MCGLVAVGDGAGFVVDKLPATIRCSSDIVDFSVYQSVVEYQGEGFFSARLWIGELGAS